MHRGHTSQELSEIESRRLFELQSLDILDTPDEDRFDRITRLASAFFKAPTALVSLVDQNRQWFKSRVGMDACETSRNIAVCHYAIEEKRFLVVNDLSRDPRFHDNPFVKDQGMRFYAGAVLRSTSGYAVGTLCILDTKPREFSDQELDFLLQFAQLVERELNEGTRLESWRNQLFQQTLFDPCSELPGRRLFLEQSRALMSSIQQAAMVVVRINNYAISALDLSLEEQTLLNREIADHIRSLFDNASVSGDLGDGRYCALIAITNPETESTDNLQHQRYLQELQVAFSQPFTLDGRSIIPTVGISLYPGDGENPEQLLIKSDLARPKRALPGTVSFYCSETAALHQRSVDIETRLREATRNESLTLCYQPKYCLADGKICGVEALLRWHDPSLGRIGPDEFIPVAEKTGLIHEITSWVMERAWQQVPELRQYLKTENIAVAINLSAQDLLKPAFPEWVERALRWHNLSGDSVVFEITESSLVEDIEQAKQNMMALKKLGITFHIDDFGTGFSNLSQLHQLPLDALKVDKSFVNQLGESVDGDIVCRSIIALAKSLNLRVIAEGVENAVQLKTLTELGCDAVQGFLLARPMEARALERLPLALSDIV
ncbi:putative bifunctional diguanylate cyclase/phosphodiesterase [Marinobacter sp.]|uniref:putative bifunctional diguanylate cyclase/phosphodiesterase n=1 Tax=Marinobacter sp. TaxID=50741 RepID=UPI00356352D5